MKNFLYMHRINFALQFVLIIIVLLGYFFSTKQYVSSVTIYPLFVSEIFATNSAAPLGRKYLPEDTFDYYLKELANTETRKEIYKEFLSNNNLYCDEEFRVPPEVQFYEKRDNSFPIIGHFTQVQVKTICKGSSKSYVEFLSNNLNKRLVDYIQKTENMLLERKRRDIIFINENDISDLEIFHSNRKEMLQKIIPLIEENNNNQILSLTQDNKEVNKINEWGGVNLDLQIPLTRSTAQIELNFLSSITDLTKTSLGLINRANMIKQYEIKHDFSKANLVNISPAEPEASSTRNFYLALFLIFIILGLGFVLLLLNEYKYHKKLQ